MMNVIENENFDEAAEATAVFCKLINDLFDLMNSKKVNRENIDEYIQVYITFLTTAYVISKTHLKKGPQ